MATQKDIKKKKKKILNYYLKNGGANMTLKDIAKKYKTYEDFVSKILSEHFIKKREKNTDKINEKNNQHQKSFREFNNV